MREDEIRGLVESFRGDPEMVCGSNRTVHVYMVDVSICLVGTAIHR